MLTLIQYFVPLILIIWAIVIGLKKVITKKGGNVSERVVKKIVLAIFMFFLPLFISILIGLLMPDSFRECVSHRKCCVIGTSEVIETNE